MTLPATSAAELAELRADFDAALLPDLAEHRRADPGQPATAPWTVRAPALPCRLVLSGAEPDDGASDAMARVGANARVLVPADTDVRRGDALVIDGRRCAVVLVVPAPRAHREVMVAVDGIPV